MAIRSILLPASVLACPFLVNACGHEPTAVAMRTSAQEARLLAVDQVLLKLQPTAGNFSLPDFAKQTGNGTYSQAQWTNKLALDGRFSVLLEKSVDFASCYTTTPENGCAAFAAVIVNGVEGMTIADLAAIGFSVSGTCGAGSPRFNLYYDTNGDGQSDGVAFYGCAAHASPSSPAPDWTSMSASSTAPDFCYSFATGLCTLTASSTVVQLSIIVDEMGTWYIDRVQAAGATAGEPNGS